MENVEQLNVTWKNHPGDCQSNFLLPKVKYSIKASAPQSCRSVQCRSVLQAADQLKYSVKCS